MQEQIVTSPERVKIVVLLAIQETQGILSIARNQRKVEVVSLGRRVLLISSTFSVSPWVGRLPGYCRLPSWPFSHWPGKGVSVSRPIVSKFQSSTGFGSCRNDRYP